MTALLEIEDLHVSFHRGGALSRHFGTGPREIAAVAGVTLAVDPGQTVALVGESGSGKTTLARAVIGLAPVRSGRIRFEGQDITGLADRAMQPVRNSQFPVASAAGIAVFWVPHLAFTSQANPTHQRHCMHGGRPP